MERKFLEDQGLEKEVIDKIMAEHGKSIQAEKDKTKTKEEELKVAKDSLTKANEEIKSYKDMDIDQIKKNATEWEEKAKGLKKEIQQIEQESALDRKLAMVNTYDVDMLKKALNREELIYKDDEFIGLDDQIKKLKEEKAYLFKDDHNNSNEGDKPSPDSRFKSFVPNSDPEPPKSELEAQMDSIFGF